MQIYNIENAYYNLQLTFLNNFTFKMSIFMKIEKGLTRITQIATNLFFLPQIQDFKD